MDLKVRILLVTYPTKLLTPWRATPDKDNVEESVLRN